MLKTLTFTLMHFCIAFGVAYALTGSATVGGSFAFNSPTTAPTVSQSGTSFAVTFTPSDTSNYNTVSGSVAVTVNWRTLSVGVSVMMHSGRRQGR